MLRAADYMLPNRDKGVAKQRPTACCFMFNGHANKQRIGHLDPDTSKLFMSLLQFSPAGSLGIVSMDLLRALMELPGNDRSDLQKAGLFPDGGSGDVAWQWYVIMKEGVSKFCMLMPKGSVIKLAKESGFSMQRCESRLFSSIFKVFSEMLDVQDVGDFLEAAAYMRDYQWVWLVGGHGFSGDTIADIPLQSFGRLLTWLNTSIATRAVLVDSCFSVGISLAAVMEQYVGAPGLQFPVICSSVPEGDALIAGVLPRAFAAELEKAQPSLFQLVAHWVPLPEAYGKGFIYDPRRFPFMVAPGALVAKPVFDVEAISVADSTSRGPERVWSPTGQIAPGTPPYFSHYSYVTLDTPYVRFHLDLRSWQLKKGWKNTYMILNVPGCTHYAFSRVSVHLNSSSAAGDGIFRWVSFLLRDLPIIGKAPPKVYIERLDIEESNRSVRHLEKVMLLGFELGAFGHKNGMLRAYGFEEGRFGAINVTTGEVRPLLPDEKASVSPELFGEGLAEAYKAFAEEVRLRDLHFARPSVHRSGLEEDIAYLYAVLEAIQRQLHASI